MAQKWDFSGWATKNDVRCRDGRIIRNNAFEGCNHVEVPLVWNHKHDSPGTCCGKALLENRPGEGVYAYCSVNETDAGKNAKLCVQHGDVTRFSIFANDVKQNRSGEVFHGVIRELSLVYAGANPEAYIDYVSFEHNDDDEIEHGEAYICSMVDPEYAIDVEYDIRHSDETDEEANEPEESAENESEVSEPEASEEPSQEIEHADPEMNEENVNDILSRSKEILKTLNKEQQIVVCALLGSEMVDNAAAEKDNGGNNEMSMTHNLFEGQNEAENTTVLSHSDMENIFNDAQNHGGSLRSSFNTWCSEHDFDPESLMDSSFAHSIDSTTIGYLYPEFKNTSREPKWIKRPTEWVAGVINGTSKSPFTKVRSVFADITANDARAKGYIKGNAKLEETFSLLKRETEPQTVYKLQKMDRDDVLDITDFDVLAWIKGEMRMMLEEEIARAILVGDGRSSVAQDKIKEDKIRPIWTDSTDLFVVNNVLTFTSSMTPAAKAGMFIDECVRPRKDYRGSGNPTLFTTEEWLTEMLLIKDTNGHRIYKSEAEVATACRVKNIVTVPVMENQTRTITTTSGSETRTLLGIIVNLADYTVGSNKGGQITMFEDFDINYNKMEKLIETRICGALTIPYSAIVLESVSGN